MYFHDPSSRAFKDLFPGVRTRTFWGERHLLSLVDLDAGCFLPRHSHPHEQSTYVLEGELEFEVGDQKRLIRAGEVVIIPGGVEHLVKVGSKPARVLDVFCPVREDFKY